MCAATGAGGATVGAAGAITGLTGGVAGKTGETGFAATRRLGSNWGGRHRRNGLGSHARRWRDRTSNAWRCRAAGERHTPEAEGRLSELKFDVSARAARRLGFHHLADNFLLCFLVRQKNQLTRTEWRGDADHGAVGENQHGLSGFRKRDAFIGAIHSASAINGNGNLDSDRLRTRWRFIGRLRLRSGRSCSRCARSGGFEFFQNRCHKIPTQRGIKQKATLRNGLSRHTYTW